MVNAIKRPAMGIIGEGGVSTRHEEQPTDHTAPAKAFCAQGESEGGESRQKQERRQGNQEGSDSMHSGSAAFDRMRPRDVQGARSSEHPLRITLPYLVATKSREVRVRKLRGL